MLLSFLLFLSNMLLLANMLLLVILLLLDFLLLTAFLLLLASLLILMSLFQLVALHTGLQNEMYYTIGLSFLSAIEISEYRISYWRTQETIGLSDIGSRPKSIGLSDIGLRKIQRLPTSEPMLPALPHIQQKGGIASSPLPLSTPLLSGRLIQENKKTLALHMGQVVSLSNQVETQSSQKMCLHCSMVGSWQESWNKDDYNTHTFYLLFRITELQGTHFLIHKSQHR